MSSKNSLHQKKLLHQPYDHTLKKIFSHTEMMKSLLKGFVPESWVKELDFGTLKKVNIKHLTHDLKYRENDVIWEIYFKNQPLYIICLLEFQSDIDNFMAIRLLTYVGLVYEDLLLQKRYLGKAKKLPPIFSLVFYSGRQQWNAPLSVQNCIASGLPAGLKKYQPAMEYLLLDLKQLSLDKYDLAPDNLVAPLIELNQVSDSTRLDVVLKKLVALLKAPEFDSLRRAMTLYLTKALRLSDRYPDVEINDLEEMNKMLLSENWKKICRQELQEEILANRMEGRREGQKEGQEALKKVLKQLLAKQAPHQKKAYQAIIENAEISDLQAWLEAALNGESLESLFDYVPSDS